MPATLTTLSTIMKEVYEPDIRDQLQSEAVALKRIERTSDGVESKVGGKYVVFPIRTRRNHGIGSRNELEALPAPGQQGFNSGRVQLAYQYGGVELSGQTFELANEDYQAFTSALDVEVDGLKEDLVKDQNRQVYGTSRGTLATATAAGAGVLTFTALNGVKYLEEGMQVDIVDITTIANPTPTLRAADRQIVSINTTTGVVTLSGAVFTTAVGDILVRQGSVNREIIGLASIVSNTGTLYNIDPTVETKWKAALVDANGGVNRALSEGLMINAVDAVRQNGGNVSLILAGLGVRRSYFNLLVQQRRFTNTTEFEGGFRGLAFTTDKGDVPMVTDMDAPNNTMYFLDEKRLKLYRPHEWQWMNRDGSMWQRKITSAGAFDAYNATMYIYDQLGTDKRNAFAVMQDITES